MCEPPKSGLNPRCGPVGECASARWFACRGLHQDNGRPAWQLGTARVANMTTPTEISAAEGGVTKQERVDFLKSTLAFTEATVRSYDVKAQISLAAFVLSGNPLVAIINGACGPSAGRGVLVITLVAFVATIFMYLWVLWPVALPQQLTEGLGAKSLFYLHNPLEESAPFRRDNPRRHGALRYAVPL